QFSFCASLFEALVGLPPFHRAPARHSRGGATHRERLSRALAGRAPAMVRRAVTRGLSVAAADRFPSMQELLVELEASLRRRGRRVLWAAGGAALLATTAAVTYRLARRLPRPVGPGVTMVGDFEGGSATAPFGWGWESSSDQVLGGRSQASIDVVP